MEQTGFNKDSFIARWRARYYAKHMIDLRAEKHRESEMSKAGERFIEAVKK